MIKVIKIWRHYKFETLKIWRPLGFESSYDLETFQIGILRLVRLLRLKNMKILFTFKIQRI